MEAKRNQNPRPFKVERVGHPKKLNQSISDDVLKWYHHNVICRQEENCARVGHPPSKLAEKGAKIIGVVLAARVGIKGYQACIAY
jgi:hypothetical protein